MITVKFKTGFNEATLFDQISRLIKTYNGKDKATIKSILEFRVDELKDLSIDSDSKDIGVALEIYQDLIEILAISDMKEQITLKEYPKVIKREKESYEF